MEQHEKNEGIPKRLRLMKKRLKQALALVGILIITLALSGCEKFVETEVSAEETFIQTTISETATAKSSKPKEPVEPIGEDSYGSPAYPLPDDWTFEKIVNLIEIDGVSLSLSSVPEDFNNINKKIKSEWDQDFTIYYDVYYKDEIILTVRKSKDESFDGAILRYVGDNQEIIDAITFAGYSLREANEIYDYMNTNFIVSKSGDYGKRYSIIDGNFILEIRFVENSYENFTVVSINIKISEVEE